MTMLDRLLIRLSGNRYAQNLLERQVLRSQHLMGIGAGAGVASSGEGGALRSFGKRCRPPYCVFDVGSNRGQFLQVLLDVFPQEQLVVHAFEPGEYAFSILRESYGGNAHIRMNNVAIGKTAGNAVLHYDRHGAGLASLTRRKLEHFNINMDKSELVTVTTVDEYCLANNIPRISLLKIDVEGHEFDVLCGAGRMFDEKAIDAVMFEFGGTNIDTRVFFQDFWYFLKDRDMAVFRITPSGYLYPIESYREIHEQFRATNFAAFARG